MNNLSKIRAKKGITLQELANTMNTAKQYIHYLEKGKISANTALSIAEKLDENVFDILGLDALTLIPKTKEEKECLLKTINDIEVE